MYIISEDVQDRVIMLLECAYNLLQKQNESPFVLNMLEETVEYDGAECDGNCLLDDIENVLSMVDIYPDEYSGKFTVE